MGQGAKQTWQRRNIFGVSFYDRDRSFPISDPRAQAPVRPIHQSGICHISTHLTGSRSLVDSLNPWMMIVNTHVNNRGQSKIRRGSKGTCHDLLPDISRTLHDINIGGLCSTCWMYV